MARFRYPRPWVWRDVTGLIYIGTLALAQAAISVPFNWFSTFVIEERFGFNTTTRATFALDLLKGAALCVVSGRRLAGVLWFLTGPATWRGSGVWV